MTFDIRDYGAKGDGTTDNTVAIQGAINACRDAGGGRILVEEGVYLTAPIRLYSNMELHLEANGTLLASPNEDDYHDWDDMPGLDQTHLARKRGDCFIFIGNAHHVSITGRGTIDANGKAFVEAYDKTESKTGWVHKSTTTYYRRKSPNTPPRVVFFACCQNVLVEGISIVNGPAGWSLFVHNVDDGRISGITIFAELDFPNNDGIHINCSRKIRVSDCNIHCADDAIVVRANSYSLPENKASEDVVVTNCTLVSHCGGIRLGWIHDGVIRNCTFSNLTMLNTRTGILLTFPWRGEERTADEGREALLIDNILFSDIVMDRIFTHPIRLWMDRHENTHAEIQAVKNLHFRNIHARALLWPSLEARKDAKAENIVFSDCSFEIINQTDEFGDFRYLGGRPEKIGTQLFENIKNLRLSNTTFTMADDVEEATKYDSIEDEASIYRRLGDVMGKVPKS